MRLQPTQWNVAVRSQLDLIRFKSRNELLALAALAAGLFLVAVFNARIPVLFGTSGPDGDIWALTLFGASDFGLVAAPGLMAVVLAYIFACGIGLLRPLRDWAGEPPRHRSFHLSLPVARSRHNLARVTAGLVLVLGMTVTLLIFSVLGLVVGGNFGSLGALDFTAWAAVFVCPMILHLAVSVVCILANRPGWVLWAIGLGSSIPAVICSLIEFVPGEKLFGALMNGSFSHSALLASGFFPALLKTPAPRVENWWSVAAVWLVLAVIAVVAAAHRHREK